MLIKSQFVATQFHVLMRAVANALDALPLHEIDACSEVKELIELLTKQARKVKLEHDPNDEREEKRVGSILNQLEKGTEPNADSMKQVLDYLEIKTWTDCNKEIKFLEDESHSNEREGEVPLLSGLTGFLCYCRVVIFETLDFQSLRSENSEARCSTNMLSCVTPDDFRCPISLELMTDPVTVSTGHTYNRASIDKWLKAGNMTCPKTGERLTTTEFFPNTALKTLIQRFCYDNGVTTASWSHHNSVTAATKTVEAGSPAAAHAMQFTSWFLTRRLVFGTEEQKNKAAYEVRLLAKSNVFNRACLAEMGTVPPLLDLLATDDTQENAIAALLKLSKHATGQQVIMETRGLPQIVKVLKNGHSLEARRIAAATIFYLSAVKKYRKLIGENPDAIPALVEMIREGITYAVVAIFGLLLLPRNRPKVVADGAVPAIIGVLACSDNAHLVTDCLAVLVALAESAEGARAIFEASGLPLVTGFLGSATSRAGREYCVSILLSLCGNIGAEVIGVLAKDLSVMPMLYALITEGTPRAAKKARSLINVLQEFYERRASSGMPGSSVS